MNLNKHKKKYHIMTYGENRILTRGKRELYPFVYKRTWDLTIYDVELLNSYGLKKAVYVYIGQSDKYNLKARCSDWRYEVEENRGNVAKCISIFIGKLKLFLCYETDLTEEEIRELLYYSAEVIARCESVRGSKKLEKHFNSKCHWNDSMGEILEEQTILLSKVDSGLREIKDGAVRILQDKSHKIA